MHVVLVAWGLETRGVGSKRSRLEGLHFKEFGSMVGHEGP